MFETIKWEPRDGQYLLYACNVLVQEAFQKGHIKKKNLDNFFSTRKVVVVVYDSPKMYLEMSKRQNDLNIPKGQSCKCLADFGKILCPLD